MRTRVLQFGKNIRSKDARSVYYLLTFLTELMISLVAATYVLFLLHNGLDFFEVMLVNLAFMVGIFFFEIPTGAYADIFGRRKSVILCFLFIAVSFGIYFVSNSFLLFVIAEIFAALAFTFMSGALDAWLVDSYEKQEYVGNVDHMFSNAEIIARSAGIIGGVIGGYVGSVNLALPFGIGALGMFLTMFIAILFIHESFVQKNIPSFASSLRHFADITKSSIRFSLKNKVVLWLIISSIVTAFAFMPLNMYWSPRMNELAGNQVWIVGWIWALMALFMMAGGYLVKHLLKKQQSYTTIMITMVLFLAIPILISSVSTIFGIVLYSFLFYEIGRGMQKPAHKAYMNKFIPSEQRATILSFDSMIGRTGAVMGLIIFGLIAKQYGIETSWFIAGVILLLLIPIYLRTASHEKHTAT